MTPQTAGGLSKDSNAKSSGAFDELKPDLRKAQANLGGVGHVASVSWAVYDLRQATGGGSMPPVVVFSGLTGTFNQQALIDKVSSAMSAGTMKKVSAGPHGGVAECAITSQADLCVWATNTTFGTLSIGSSGTRYGSNLATLMVRMRNDLEK
ncbi:MAG: hypothetical protein ACM3ML_35960 [Micromonosporaceae bacterium]